MKTKVLLLALLLALAAVAVSPRRALAQSCNVCVSCGQSCNLAGGYSQACCGAGGHPGCQVGCETHGNGCTAYSLCWVTCPGSNSSNVAKCTSNGTGFGLLSDPALATDSGPGALVYTTAPEGRYTVTFEKPAVAVILEVTHTSEEGSRFTGLSKYDNFLREGRTTIEGSVPTMKEPRPIASTVRVRYVEYLDGTSEGDLTEEIAQSELRPLRERVKAHALRYAAQLRRYPRTRVVKNLSDERRAAQARGGADKSAQDALPTAEPPPLSFATIDPDALDVMALAQVEVNFSEKRTDALIARLERLAK